MSKGEQQNQSASHDNTGEGDMLRHCPLQENNR